MANPDRLEIKLNKEKYQTGINQLENDLSAKKAGYETILQQIEFENVDKTLELILNKPARFSPGTDYEYSNTNYLLINMLIEKTLIQ